MGPMRPGTPAARDLHEAVLLGPTAGLNSRAELRINANLYPSNRMRFDCMCLGHVYLRRTTWKPRMRVAPGHVVGMCKYACFEGFQPWTMCNERVVITSPHFDPS